MVVVKSNGNMLLLCDASQLRCAPFLFICNHVRSELTRLAVLPPLSFISPVPRRRKGQKLVLKQRRL